MWLLVLILMTPNGLIHTGIDVYDTYENCLELVIDPASVGLNQSVSLLGCVHIGDGTET